jgi:hypothetical protein
MGFWGNFRFKSVLRSLAMVTITDIGLLGHRLRDPLDRYIHAGPSIFANTRLQAKSFAQVRRL